MVSKAFTVHWAIAWLRNIVSTSQYFELSVWFPLLAHQYSQFLLECPCGAPLAIYPQFEFLLHWQAKEEKYTFLHYVRTIYLKLLFQKRDKDKAVNWQKIIIETSPQTVKFLPSSKAFDTFIGLTGNEPSLCLSQALM